MSIGALERTSKLKAVTSEVNKSVNQRKLHGEKDERRRRREVSGYCISQG